MEKIQISIVRAVSVVISLYLVYVCFYVPFLNYWGGDQTHWEFIRTVMDEDSGDSLNGTILSVIISGVIMIVAPIYSLVSMGAFYKYTVHRVVSSIIPLVAGYAFVCILTDGFDHRYRLGEGDGESVRKYIQIASFLLLIGVGLLKWLLRLLAPIYQKYLGWVERMEARLFGKSLDSHVFMSTRVIVSWSLAFAAYILIVFLFINSPIASSEAFAIFIWLIVPLGCMVYYAYPTKLGKGTVTSKVFYCSFVYVSGVLCLFLFFFLIGFATSIVAGIVSVPQTILLR